MAGPRDGLVAVRILYYLIEGYVWLLDNVQNEDIENQPEEIVGDTTHILIPESEVEMMEFVAAAKNNS